VLHALNQWEEPQCSPTLCTQPWLYRLPWSSVVLLVYCHILGYGWPFCSNLIVDEILVSPSSLYDSIDTHLLFQGSIVLSVKRPKPLQSGGGIIDWIVPIANF